MLPNQPHGRPPARKVDNRFLQRTRHAHETGRNYIGRLLDQKDGYVTLSMLQRAARIVARSLCQEEVVSPQDWQSAAKPTATSPASGEARRVRPAPPCLEAR